ncbi:50S ribosomal protein L34e [Stygiolobus caldivivus]|uniref:Large ribosomal subunit protein eL34 n=1 Tax=Stygiolobus caldivivus TaxID=2824673 RepID=A0A8D5ZG48_9CREN|nr:50S ribosomal protein L34e [Stygiolobus caldivivus]BCU70663.1 50S ribosomal protein L34e [Stygiolobus caldivivus]
MPSPQQRSRSLRRVYIRTPSGKSKIHYEDKKTSEAVCAICKEPLRGVKTDKVYKYSKTEKRPERPFGGYLCHKCLERLIKNTLRGY